MKINISKDEAAFLFWLLEQFQDEEDIALEQGKIMRPECHNMVSIDVLCDKLDFF